MAFDRSTSEIPARAIFLDLDGTLLDDSTHQEVLVRTCEEIAATEPGLDGARLADAHKRVRASYWLEVGDSFMLGAIDGASANLEAWRRTLRACGCSDEAVVRRAADIHNRIDRAAYRPFGEVPDFLAALTGSHVPLALITNGAADVQRDKIDVLGIGHMFSSVLISGEVGVSKPDPGIFELALDRLAMEREAAWHVGDSLASDVAGANAAGLTSVWLNRNGVTRTEDDAEPDFEIRSLLDLLTLRHRGEF